MKCGAKALRAALGLLLAVLLGGCAAAPHPADLWDGAVTALQNSKNVSLRVRSAPEADPDAGTETTERFAFGLVYRCGPAGETMLARAGAECWLYLRSEEPPLWVRQLWQAEPLAFVPAETLLRLRRLSAAADAGQLHWQPDLEAGPGTGVLSGAFAGGGYLLGETLHIPLEVKLHLAGGRPVYLRERYRRDGPAGEIWVDEVFFEDWGTTLLRLPRDAALYSAEQPAPSA